jgi:hypothetical protein
MGAVIAFAPRSGSSARLTLCDRIDVTQWQEQASRHGYDRLVIHERGPMDPPDVESFLSVYPRGDMWARWGITRSGASVLAWCSRSGSDIGRFASVGDALSALLRGGKGGPGGSGQVIRAFG